MKILDDEIYENFKDWVKRLSEKALDLSAPKENVKLELFNRFLTGYYKGIKSFSKSILKSYILSKEREEEVFDFINPEDLTIKKPIELINKFLKEYIVENNAVDCKNAGDVGLKIAESIFEYYQSVFGKTIYFDMLYPGFKTMPEVKKSIVEVYKSLGYVAYPKDPRFLISSNVSEPLVPNPKNQETILKMYYHIYDVYVWNYQSHINSKFTEDRYNEFWGVVKLFFNSLETLLTDESKHDEGFVKIKKKVDNFFESTQEKVRRIHTQDGRYGDYCKAIRESLKHYMSGSFDNSDLSNLQEFYERTVRLHSALDIFDENGQNYPVNYFVCMPIHPTTIIDLLSRFQKSDFLTEKQKLLVGDTKRLIRFSFPDPRMANNGDVAKVEEVLLPFRNKIKLPDGTVRDLTNAGNFEKFVSTVSKFIEDNKLPKYEVCISCVGRDIYKGRPPITVDAEGRKKDESNIKNKSTHNL